MMINSFEDYLRSIGSDPEIIFDPNYVNQTRDLAQRLQNVNVQLEVGVNA